MPLLLRSSPPFRLLGALLLLNLSAGCNEPAATPHLAGPGAPAPSPAPGTAAGWTAVREFKDCPYPDCPARAGFTVEPTGKYTYGSAPYTETGNLSSKDLSELTDHAERVVEQDLPSLSPTCEILAVLPGMSTLSIDLVTAGGVSRRVYEQNAVTGTRCWLGDRGRAERLGDSLDGLARDYAP